MTQCMNSCAKTAKAMESIEECCPNGKLCPCQTWFDGCNDATIVNGKMTTMTKR